MLCLIKWPNAGTCSLQWVSWKSSCEGEELAINEWVHPLDLHPPLMSAPMALNMTYACLYIRFFICLGVSARATHIIMFVVRHNLPWMKYIEAFHSCWHQWHHVIIVRPAFVLEGRCFGVFLIKIIRWIVIGRGHRRINTYAIQTDSNLTVIIAPLKSSHLNPDCSFKKLTAR